MSWSYSNIEPPGRGGRRTCRSLLPAHPLPDRRVVDTLAHIRLALNAMTRRQPGTDTPPPQPYRAMGMHRTAEFVSGVHGIAVAAAWPSSSDDDEEEAMGFHVSERHKGPLARVRVRYRVSPQPTSWPPSSRHPQVGNAREPCRAALVTP